MKMKRIACSSLLFSLLCAPALAQDDDGSVVATPSEPLVVSDYQTTDAGPQIVIRPGEQEVFYEYRVNGELKEIKVVPEVGPEYYLVPAEGGGWIRETESEMLIPSWVLFRW